MINRLRGMAIFAMVVEQGSFRAAASRLGLSPSWVSEAVSELEKDVGVTFLYRSTRSLSTTPEGQVLYEQAKIMLDAAEKGLDFVTPSADTPKGLLRASFPAFVTKTALMDTIEEFTAAYPDIMLHLDFSDHQRDLIKEGYDIGIRIGVLKDSELLTRRIGNIPRLLVCSRSYAEGRDMPTRPSEVEAWDWVQFAVRGDQFTLTSADGETAKVKGRGNTTVNSADAVHQLVLRGFGLSPLPENIARKGIEVGDFVHILPDWTLDPLGLHAVWPNRANKENLTMVLVRFLTETSQHNQQTALRMFP